MIIDRQVRRQQARGCECDRAVGDRLEKRRQPSPGARYLDAVVGGALVEMQDLDAIGEERRATLAEVQSPRVDLNQRDQETCGCTPLVCRQALNLGEQLIVGERIEGRFEHHVRL